VEIEEESMGFPTNIYIMGLFELWQPRWKKSIYAKMAVMDMIWINPIIEVNMDS
jgi:hypothetical protein